MTWTPLTESEKQLLYLEQGYFRWAGAKDQQIGELLGMSPTRYYQKLNALIDDPRAMAWDPLTVKRLQRLRDARRAARSKRA
jgi:hypothetical protein